MNNDLVFDDEMYWKPVHQGNRPDWIISLNDAFYDADVSICKDYFLSIREDISENLYGWVKSAISLYWVRRRKAYLSVYSTWREFCEKWLHKKSYQVNQLIKCAGVIKELIEAGFNVLPQNQSQAFKLSKLTGQKLIEAWEKVLLEVPTHLITANAIEATINGEPLATKKRLEVPMPEWEKFQQRCLEAGLDPKDELQKVLSNYDPETKNVDIDDELEDDEVEPVDPDKVEAWEEDLKQLVNEHQVAYNLSVFSVKVILDWVDRFRNILPNPPE